MKKRVSWLVVPAFALSLGACQKKGTPSEGPSSEVVVPAVPALSAEERAARLGFASHLPKDAEGLMVLYNTSQNVNRLKSSKLWKVVEEQTNAPELGLEREIEEEEVLPEDDLDAAADEASEIAEMFGKEVILAFGKGTGEQFGHLVTFHQRSSYFQMKALAMRLVQSPPEGEDGEAPDAVFDSGFGTSVIQELLHDPESGVALFDQIRLAPLYAAVRTDEARRQEVAEQAQELVSLLSMFGDVAEPVEFEKLGSTFSGYRVLGEKLSETLIGDRTDLEEDTREKLRASLAKKRLVAASGVIGEYVVIFLGHSEEDFDLVASPGDSLLAGDALAFTDAYSKQELAALLYGEKNVLDALQEAAKGFTGIAEGFRAGLASNPAIDTSDLELTFKTLADREQALRKLGSADDWGVLAFWEQGLKIESFGGYDTGKFDWKKATRLSHLGESPDVALFVNAVGDPAYGKASVQYVEALSTTAYALSQKLANAPSTGEELEEFKAGLGMFDAQFKGELISLWNAFSVNLAGGLGDESALIVDLNGTVPPLPGVPQAVVDQGRFPRATYLAPVVDRSNIAASWEEINKTTTGLLAKFSEMSGVQIPMQKPMSSERNGATTWFFSFPFFNDDFLPSVTVSDQWFAASTSKEHTLGLIAQAEKGSEGPSGLVFRVNFAALQSYASEMLRVMEEHSGEILGEESVQQVEFRNNQTLLKKIIAAFDEIDSLTVRSYQEGSQLRSSIHFKTR